MSTANVWRDSTRSLYPTPLRCFRFKDPEAGRKLVFITNHLNLAPLMVCQLYNMRWQVELFFKWIKHRAGDELREKKKPDIALAVYVTRDQPVGDRRSSVEYHSKGS